MNRSLRVHCFTSASFSYLDRARVLAESVRQYHPEWTLWLLLSDEAPPDLKVNLADGCFDHVVRITELDIPDLRRWMFGHDIVDLCTAVKGPMLHRLLPDADAVVFLDPDIALFAPLADVTSLLTRQSVVLTPHILQQEEQEEAIFDNEIGSLRHGVYNLGFLAVRNCQQGRRFAAWWRDRLLAHCHDDIEGGLFTDQRWCNLAPALFDEVHVLRDPGYNVASWNLGSRPLEIGSNGRITAGGRPLRFFHFTKVNSIGEGMLERYSYGRTEVFELLRWYRERLAVHAPEGLPPGWWAYGTYSDGTAIERSHRVTWRTRADLRDAFNDPYASGPGTFHARCVEKL